MSGRRDVYPLLPLRGVFAFPHLVVPLEVGRQRSISALESVADRDRLLVFASQREVHTDTPRPEDIYDVGTLAEIKQMVKLPGGTFKVVVEGVSRVEILEYLETEPHFSVRIREVREERDHSKETEASARSLVHNYEQYMKASKKMAQEGLANFSVESPGRLADTITSQLDVRTEEKQAVLEAFSVRERLDKVQEILNRQVELQEMERRINVRVRKQMERTQREYYLREQIKAIQRELGERDEKGSETEELRSRIESLALPQEAREKAVRELERLEKMPPMSAEAVVVRNYLDWILALPWEVETQDQLDLTQAERILEEDHYGLSKVKERILEYLAIRKLVKNMKGPILCLVGPPGVGKTSLGRSIARALGRHFARISLGGVRDEAEIRGHRRTYVGALPGRIIQGMRQAASRNPVFLLDQVDKLSSDFRGDPSSALLEVLDPEQNQNFSDHYIELPYDLSKVMFITTANSAYNIPRPLLDRMEVINISGYTEEEKIGIARRYLLPKEKGQHGLGEHDLEVSDNTIRTLIGEYTREAGVRNLERELAALCRKAARAIVQGEKPPVRITRQNLHRYLGAPRYRTGYAETASEVGVATAVYWTEMGGDVMPIEVSVMKGKGNLLLTGKLGEVMRESAQAGFSYIRSRAATLGIPEDFHEHYDIHVHVPEGATPKEGPSAGITMATALVSALSGRPVRHDVAMTGEITLRGRVLPIGGLKEKVLAAHRAGITTMIIPADNRKDLEEIPPNVRRRMHFVLVEHMDQVLGGALVPELTMAIPAAAEERLEGPLPISH